MRNKILQYMSLLFLLTLVLVIHPIRASADDNGLRQKYNITVFNESDIGNITEKAILGVIFIDSDGTYCYGGNYDVFCYLKASNPSLSDKYQGTTWGDVDSTYDSFDEINFTAKILGTNRALFAATENTIINVLYMTQAEADFISSFFKDFEPLAIVFFLAYFFAEMAEVSQISNWSKEKLIKHFLVGLACLFFIGCADRIVNTAFSLSNSFLTLIQNSNPMTNMYNAVYYDFNEITDIAMSTDNNTFMQAFGKIASNLYTVLYGQFGSMLVLMVATGMVYARKLTFGLRCVFVQFAIASIPHGGRRSPGWRYLQSMLGDILAAACYALLVYLCLFYQSSSSDQNAASGQIITIALLISLAMVNMITKELGKTFIK